MEVSADAMKTKNYLWGQGGEHEGTNSVWQEDYYCVLN